MEVLVNAAMSADGKLSTVERRQVAISGPADFERVDRLRASVDAVMVGVGTVLADDPHLTIKDEQRRSQRADAGREPQPARVVADSGARTPTDAAVIDGAAETYVLVAERAPKQRRAVLADRGEIIEAGDERVHLPTAFRALEARGIESILVEGGGELLFSLFNTGLVDRVMVYVGPMIIGGRDAPTLADGEGFRERGEFPDLSLNRVERIDDGVLLEWEVSGGEKPTSPSRGSHEVADEDEQP